MDVHQRIAGVLLAVMGGMAVLWSLFSTVVMLGFNRTLHNTVEGGGSVWLVLMAALLVLVLFWAAAALRAGLCLYRGRRSRTVVPVAVIALLGFPMGTAAGAYTLWSLWRDGAPKAPPDWQRIAREQQVVQTQA